jgi:hypothetical protein
MYLAKVLYSFWLEPKNALTLVDFISAGLQDSLLRSE